MYNHRFSKREFFLDNIALPLGRDGIDHSTNILTILTLNDWKAIIANGGQKTRETWKLVVGLIQRPEDGINPLAEAPTNSEHPCQVNLTNKTCCIAMFSRLMLAFYETRRIFFLFISIEESLHFNVGDPAYHQTHKLSTKLSTNDTRLPSSIKHFTQEFSFFSVTHVMSDVTWAWLCVKMSKSWFK